MDGLTHADFEQMVGGKVDSKVLFYIAPDRLWYRVGGLWYPGSE